MHCCTHIAGEEEIHRNSYQLTTVNTRTMSGLVENVWAYTLLSKRKIM